MVGYTDSVCPYLVGRLCSVYRSRWLVPWCKSGVEALSLGVLPGDCGLRRSNVV